MADIIIENTFPLFLSPFKIRPRNNNSSTAAGRITSETIETRYDSKFNSYDIEFSGKPIFTKSVSIHVIIGYNMKNERIARAE